MVSLHSMWHCRGMRLKPLLKHPMGRLMLSGALLLAAVCCVVLLFERDPMAGEDDGFTSLRSAVSVSQSDPLPSANMYYYVSSQPVLVEERTRYKLKLLHFLGKLYGKRKHRSKSLAGLFASLHKEVRHFTEAGDWAHLESWVDTRAHAVLGYEWLGYNLAKQEVLDSVGYTSFQLKESKELQILHRYRGEPRAGGSIQQHQHQLQQDDLAGLLANVDSLLEARAARERYRLVPQDDKLNAPRARYGAPDCLRHEDGCPEAGVVEVVPGAQPVSGQVSWTLSGFSALEADLVYSAPFVIGGYSWQLVLSHNRSDPEGASWWGQYLYCRDAVTWPKDVHYSIVTLAQLPERFSNRIEHREMLPAGDGSMWGREYALHVRQLHNPALGFLSKDALKLLVHISVMPHGPQADEAVGGGDSTLAKVSSWLQSGASLVLLQVTQLHVAFWLCFKPLVEYLSRDLVPQGKGLLSYATGRVEGFAGPHFGHARRWWLERLPTGVLGTAGALLWGMVTTIVCAAFGWAWLVGDRIQRPPAHSAAPPLTKGQTTAHGAARPGNTKALSKGRGKNKGKSRSAAAPPLAPNRETARSAAGEGTKRFADAMAELVSATAKVRNKAEPWDDAAAPPLAAAPADGKPKVKARAKAGGKAATTAPDPVQALQHTGKARNSTPASPSGRVDDGSPFQKQQRRKQKQQQQQQQYSVAKLAAAGSRAKLAAAGLTAADVLASASPDAAAGKPAHAAVRSGWGFFQRQPQPPPGPSAAATSSPASVTAARRAQDVQVAPPAKPRAANGRGLVAAGAAAPTPPPPHQHPPQAAAAASSSVFASPAPLSYKAALRGAHGQPGLPLGPGSQHSQQPQQQAQQQQHAGEFRPFQLFDSSHHQFHPHSRDSHGSYLFSGLLDTLLDPSADELHHHHHATSSQQPHSPHTSAPLPHVPGLMPSVWQQRPGQLGNGHGLEPPSSSYTAMSALFGNVDGFGAAAHGSAALASFSTAAPTALGGSASQLNPHAHPFTPGGVAPAPPRCASGGSGHDAAIGVGGEHQQAVEYVSGEYFYDALFDVASNTWSRMSDDFGEVGEDFDSSGAGSSSGGGGSSGAVAVVAAAAAASVVDDAAVLGEQCIMCFDAPKATTLAPCGHRALCAACTKTLLSMRSDGPVDCPTCPVCRTAVESYIIRVFNV